MVVIMVVMIMVVMIMIVVMMIVVAVRHAISSAFGRGGERPPAGKLLRTVGRMVARLLPGGNSKNRAWMKAGSTHIAAIPM